MENRLVRKEERKLRIRKKLKAIEELYHLAFETKDKEKILEYKTELKLEPDAISLKDQAIALLKKSQELLNNAEVENVIKTLAERLNQIHLQIISIIEEEFKTVRTRNKRVSLSTD